MPMRLPVAILGLACMLGTQTAVRGQGLIGSTSSSGMFGGRSLTGATSMGGRTMGGSSTGGGSLGGGLGMGGGGSSGITASRERILASRAVQSFIGGDSQTRQTPVGAAQSEASTGGRMQGMQGLRAGGSRGPNQGGRATPRRSAADVRTTLNVAFSFPRTSPARVGRGLSARVAKMRSVRLLSGLRIAVVDGTATLQGVVATQHDRALIERLTRFEAGIWQVKNELVVAQSPAGPSLSTPEEAAAADTPAAEVAPAKALPLDLPAEPALAQPPEAP